MRALGEFRDKRGIPPLVGILEEPITGKFDCGTEQRLRREAITALKSIGDSSVISLLERIESNDDEYGLVRLYAKDAVQWLRGQKPTLIARQTEKVKQLQEVLTQQYNELKIKRIKLPDTGQVDQFNKEAAGYAKRVQDLRKEESLLKKLTEKLKS